MSTTAESSKNSENRSSSHVDQVPIEIKRLDSSLPIPKYAKEGDAGADLYSAQTITLEPGQRTLISTGLAIGLPEGFVGLVHPRSGLATKHGITIVNAPGTIDSGYRGEIKVCLLNTDLEESFHINHGDRIAQLVIQKYEHAFFKEVEKLSQTQRGEQGFGSSGGFTS